MGCSQPVRLPASTAELLYGSAPVWTCVDSSLKLIPIHYMTG
jgi:hypothetical protein